MTLLLGLVAVGYLALVATISLIAVLHGDRVRRRDARSVLDILVHPRRLKSSDLIDTRPTTQMSDSSTD